MFLLVSGRHVGAHLGGHQHGVPIQIFINLGKTFLRLSSIRKIAVTWILARDFAYLSSFYFQILDSICWTVLIFYFDLFLMAWHWKPAILVLSVFSDVMGDQKSSQPWLSFSIKIILYLLCVHVIFRKKTNYSTKLLL